MAVILPAVGRRTDDESDPANEAPAVRAVAAALRRAVTARASDVHLEPDERGGGKVRLRVDGQLRDDDRIPAKLFAPLCSRLKLLAGLDIANRRLPQDGRFSLDIDGNRVHARVATLPSIDGEKIAIRLLERHTDLPELEQLGMGPEMLELYRASTRSPWGVIVVGGPTGSGKTTTVYASIGSLDRETRNVCTVEDPVEARIDGTLQVQVNPKSGLTFPIVLRAFVRQDPDVIMIGEMRDEETVAVGIAAALTGRTVFATVHSTDAVRTIDRLVELGVSRHSLAAGLCAVLAQRLVRRLCPRCAVPASVPSELARSIKLSSWLTPTGCPACRHTGYAGRVGIFEFLTIDDRLREAIASGASGARLALQLQQRGHRFLRDDAVSKLADGSTSAEEVVRAVGALAA